MKFFICTTFLSFIYVYICIFWNTNFTLSPLLKVLKLYPNFLDFFSFFISYKIFLLAYNYNFNLIKTPFNLKITNHVPTKLIIFTRFPLLSLSLSILHKNSFHFNYSSLLYIFSFGCFRFLLKMLVITKFTSLFGVAFERKNVIKPFL